MVPFRYVAAALLALAGWLVSAGATAAPGDAQAEKGLFAAKKGDCVKAVPLLEEAELARHTPTTAYALAGCYVALGELIQGADLYRAIAREKPSRRWTNRDRYLAGLARRRAAEIDARIPTVSFKPEQAYDDFEVTVDDKPVSDPAKPRQVLPNVRVTVIARAKGKRELEQDLVLKERERRVLKIRLEDEEVPPAAPPPPPAPQKAPSAPPPTPKPKTAPPPPGHQTWAGARFRSFIVPKFVMNIFGDAGTTVFVPGGGATVTARTSDADMVFSLAYSNYSMGDTPYKPKGTPETEYEFISSDLQALYLTVDLMWDLPITQSRDVSFRIGGSVGVGWTFAGDLHRTQAYPTKGSHGDPYLWGKCNGPNDPAGSYRYCNQLDKDKDHYGDFAEPNWFEGGARPLVYPFLALPVIGLSWKVSPGFALDLEAGLSTSGILAGLGGRIGL